ncbi:RNI-like protein [Serendipita vermifera]|nr:RNI-like protein [Serendipita vermifera]
MTSRGRTSEHRRRKSHKLRSPSPVQSSDSEVDLENDDDQIRNYAPTSPAQWSHHRHSVNSTVEGHPQAGRGSVERRGTQTACRSPIDSLPLELLIHIFRQLTETSHLYNCLFVSSTWCQCAVELLWLKPHLASLDSLLAFLRIIQPGFDLNAPESNGEINFDSREVLVNGRWQSRESATAQIEPYFPYARFVRRLNLSGVSDDIQDVHFRCLTACTRLERLTLNGCIHLTDNSLPILGNMLNLVALDLTGVVDVTDATILLVANACNKIQGINLEGCKKVTDTGLLAIAENCPLLRRIKLCDLDRITGSSVSKLVHQCPLLIEIDLNGCTQIDEGAVRDIWTHCNHLRELRLAQCSNIGDFAFPASPRLAKPASTGAGPSNTTPIVLPLLPPLLLSRPLSHLRQLDLMSVHITDEAVSGIVANAPRLRNLVLAKCSTLTDAAVRSISELGRHLQFLHLGHAAAITDSSIRHLAKSCVRLRYVDLACCISLTDDSVRALAALPKLRRIGLVRVPNLTDDAVRYLTARGNTLERVHLSYCERITVRAIYVLLKRLTRLTHLSLTGVPAFRRSELQQFCRPPPSNFNDTQRAAFCVYSGAGIHHLRKYLEKIAHSVQREGQADEDDGGAAFGSLGDNLIYETDEDVQELDEHDFLSNMPQIGHNGHHQAQADNSDRNPSTSRYQSVATQPHSSVRNGSPSTHEQPHTNTGSPLHLILRTTANTGSSRQSSRRQRDETRTTNMQGGSSTPVAYAGMAATEHDESSMRHRSNASAANSAATALMHARLQRVSPRVDEGTSSTSTSAATAFDRRRPYQSWLPGNRSIQTSNVSNGEANGRLYALEREPDSQQASITIPRLTNGHRVSPSRTSTDHSSNPTVTETPSPSNAALQAQTTQVSPSIHTSQ